MKYLFVTYGAHSQNNAVFNICRELARHFVAEGNSVTILGHSVSRHAPRGETIEGVSYRYFYCPSLEQAQEIWVTFRKNLSFPKLIKQSFLHPDAAFINIRKALPGGDPVAAIYASQITRWCRENSVDAVISFSAPYHTAAALARANTWGAKKIVYMADPYSTHHEYGSKTALRREAHTLKQVDAAVVTREIYTQYQHTPLHIYASKIIPSDFPCVAEKQTVPFTTFEPGRIHCLFAGNFYHSLRPPAAFLSLIEAIEDPSILFTAMGNMEEILTSRERDRAAQLVEAGRLRMIPMQPAAVAYGAMASAHILVNLGNSNPQMLPSKLFDYISIGKPILNLCIVSDCPSLSIIEKYPLHKNILCEEFQMTTCHKDLEDFILGNAGKHIDFSQVIQLFRSYTPEYLRHIFEDIVTNEKAKS